MPPNQEGFTLAGHHSRSLKTEMQLLLNIKQQHHCKGSYGTIKLKKIFLLQVAESRVKKWAEPSTDSSALHYKCMRLFVFSIFIKHFRIIITKCYLSYFIKSILCDSLSQLPAISISLKNTPSCSISFICP